MLFMWCDFTAHNVHFDLKFLSNLKYFSTAKQVYKTEKANRQLENTHNERSKYTVEDLNAWKTHTQMLRTQQPLNNADSKCVSISENHWQQYHCFSTLQVKQQCTSYYLFRQKDPNKTTVLVKD